jgi:hypothetical protein
MKVIGWLLLCCLPFGKLYAQDSSSTIIGVQVHAGQVYAHTNAVNNIKGSKPNGFELQLAKLQLGEEAYHQAHAFVQAGWSLGYYHFGNAILGSGFIASRFIQPQYRITKQVHFYLKASIGAAYLTNPNHAIKNSTNNNYSLYLNPYLHIGTGLGLALRKHWGISLQGGFHHISNGNLQQPNKGLNWLTASLGIQYTPQQLMLPRYRLANHPSATARPLVKQVYAFFVPTQGYQTKYQGQRKWLLGINAQITKPIGPSSAITAGAEVYYDNFVLDASLPSLSSKIMLGLQAGHTFLLGKVWFSQQVGYNVFSKIYFLPNFYHRWGLVYWFSKKYSLGANLKANSDNADFFDVRLGIKL